MTEKEIFTNTVKAPAQLLDKTVVNTQRVAAALPNNPVIRRTKNYWHLLGPGLTTGASDDDPSGIATYSQTGTVSSSSGYRQQPSHLWPLSRKCAPESAW
jgi:hypothetical protein